MITIIDYDKEDMKIEKANSIITSLMIESDLKYIDFAMIVNLLIH